MASWCTAADKAALAASGLAEAAGAFPPPLPSRVAPDRARDLSPGKLTESSPEIARAIVARGVARSSRSILPAR